MENAGDPRRRGTAGGRFCSPWGDTFVAAAPFPHEKVGRIYFLRGKVIAAVCHVAAAMPLSRPGPSTSPPANAFRRPPASTWRAGPGFRTLGAFGTRRPFPPRSCIAARFLPVWECPTIIHDFVASETTAMLSPVRPSQQYRPVSRFPVNGRPNRPFEWIE
jgi:hypothetical protein